MYKFDRDREPYLYEIFKEEGGRILLKQFDGILADYNGHFMEVTEEFFKEHFSETMTPLEREHGKHGKCVDYRFEPYHDVYIYEDGFEDYVYIGD